MNILRKIVSFIVLVAAIVVMVGVCMSSSMKTVWEAFKTAFSPFDFMKLSEALYAFIVATGFPLILIMLGFIGISIPGKRK